MKSNPSGFVRKIILLSEAGVILLGVVLMWRFIQVNHIRADELLSYSHSAFFTPVQAFQNIQAGVDHSYTHAVLLSIVFKLAGAGIQAQRLLSMCFWALGGFVLFRLLRKQHVAAELALLAVVLVLFSNLGIFLATDGRFYAMLFCFALLQCSQVLSLNESSGKLSWFMFLITAFLGVLTSMLYLVFLFFLLLLILFVRLKVSQVHFPLNKLLFGLLVIAGVYFVFFRIDFFIGFLEQVYVHDVVPHMPSSEQLTTPFRWIMLPHVPFASLPADAVLFSLFFTCLMFLYRKPTKGNLMYTFSFTAVLFLVLLLVMQLLLQAVAGIPVWVPRYYAIVFFCVPVLLVLMLDRVEHKMKTLLIIFLCTGMFTRLVVEFSKVPAREKMQHHMDELAAQLKTETCVVVVEQPMHPTFEFSVYGELYIRYPLLRSKMHMVLERGPMGDDYVNLLRRLGYPLQLVTQQHLPDLHSCVILQHPADKRIFDAQSTRLLFSPIAATGD